MRKLIVSNLISLDGYASGSGGDVMALPFDTTFSDYNLELMQAADTLVSGATTYRGFVSYWPAVADDPAQPGVERAISRRHRELEHLVVSDSLTGEEDRPVAAEHQDRAQGRGTGHHRPGLGRRRRRAGDPRQRDYLEPPARRRPGRELHMMVGAGVPVDGVPAFAVRPPVATRLTEARQLGDSDIALLVYSLS